jgi:hypothetical protein
MYEGPSGSGGTRRSIIAWATCFGVPALSAAEASGARTSLSTPLENCAVLPSEKCAVLLAGEPSAVTGNVCLCSTGN